MDFRDRPPWISSGSDTISPTVMRGLSDAYGSWNTICMRLRTSRFERDATCFSVSPPRRTSPDVGVIRSSSSRPRVDFPHPDSPTMPSVSPARSASDTSLTAWTVPTCRLKMPALTGNSLTTFDASSSGGRSSTATTEATASVDAHRAVLHRAVLHRAVLHRALTARVLVCLRGAVGHVAVSFSASSASSAPSGPFAMSSARRHATG